VLRVLAHKVLARVHVDPRVHHLCARGGSKRLWLADVVLAEEKLAAEVGDLDAVVVRDVQDALVAEAQAHERKVLHELAAERAAADHEDVRVAEALLEGLAEDGNLVVVARAERGRVRGPRGLLG
jgi:hypothetical protein